VRPQLDAPLPDAQRAAQPTGAASGRREGTGRPPIFERAEVRDVLAWLALLTEPRNAAAAVRALGRPPVELRQVDLARVVQVARRRKLDVVAALGAATESPQLAPQARERIARFQELHGWASEALEREPADLFVGHLIERLGLRRRQLFAADAQDVEERVAGLAHLCELAQQLARRTPGAGARELAAQLATVAQGGLAQAEAEPSSESPAQTDPEAQALRETLALLREEVLGDVARIAGRLGELRLDTDLDVSHGIVRYLELIKLAALAERAEGLSVGAALPDLNARLLAAVTPLQREIFQSSPLDGLLGATRADLQGARGEGAGAAPAGAVALGAATAGASVVLGARGEPSLEAFLPRRGEGLVLSASDVETYRGCPLRYKLGRVLRIPAEQTLNQRFGIVVHQVLERYHCAEEQTLGLMMELLQEAWRRAGLGESERERRLRVMARAALVRYHERLGEEAARPLWFERSFAFELGPHHVRGRVDRVDELPDGSYELIDYKTGHAKTAAELQEDVQLSLYAIAAREAWQLESSRQAYYYLLDDRRVPVPQARDGTEAVRETVLRVGEGILAQDFEPTPSPPVCALCDYRIVCPAAER
jgi:RecB family exonuclease